MIFANQKTIYRDFDIRGKYPEEITDDEVFKIAKALTKYYQVKNVAIGYDIRPSAENLFSALSRGFTESGVNVVNLGLCTTPMSYFICGSTTVDMTIMITASHMPSDYNGLKITIEDAKPVTADVLQIIKEIVGAHTFSEETVHGEIISHALQPDWIKKFKDKHDLTDSNLSIVIDPANMIGILEVDTFRAFEPDITVHTIFDDYDHTCPNHEANPIKHEALTDLGKEVVCQSASLGVAFDGDADRVGFVDETGTPIPSDLIGTLLARCILEKNKGATIICDVRSSRDLINEIERLGGVALREKVGHTNIRTRMRKEDALLGVELSGHFFFKETYFSEGGPLPAFMIMELMKAEKMTLSELVASVKKYFPSGEINSTITREAADIYKDLENLFPEALVNRLDGLTLETPSWRANVRPSANDPVMRLNIESTTEAEMATVRDRLLEVIRS